ncbi:hypothetical protein EHN07_10820 [Buttiauxella warmboldiae]|uniref:Glycosyl hydrolase family 32 N-terminal domain-containing protein n=1 Tax=Buttiauxella warmboldiae TaxID=82993 RepID=A0A3N5DFG9_9ENTR|nr:hypothetical protein [Buttiauxella warmboldiae]RPH27328.1 hypothetical protein EHN07_10820 [Buttiauxella warmboldiae]
MNINEYLTPYKLNRPIFSGDGLPESYRKQAVDCPFVFYHNDKFYMMHVGFDGKGYQTALNTSENLIDWQYETTIFKRTEGEESWDAVGIAGMWILKENDMQNLPRLKKYAGRYWMIYHSYPGEGYESGPAEIGLAYTDDERLHNWRRCEKPILSWRDGNEWEKGGLYKGCLIESKSKFYLFYNAKNTKEWLWNEQIGLATSDNLLDWVRFNDNPIIKNTQNGWDSAFCADPFILKNKEKWIMYYYGFNGENAQEGIAFSDDLISWDKYPNPILKIGGENTIDSIHAHKPSVLMFNQVLYHFYTAVGYPPANAGTVNFIPELGYEESRTITLATSQPI